MSAFLSGIANLFTIEQAETIAKVALVMFGAGALALLLWGFAELVTRVLDAFAKAENKSRDDYPHENL